MSTGFQMGCCLFTVFCVAAMGYNERKHQTGVSLMFFVLSVFSLYATLHTK